MSYPRYGSSITPTQARVLEQLAQGPATMNAVARAMGSKFSTVSSALSTLQFRGLVEPVRQEGQRGRLYRRTEKADGVQQGRIVRFPNASAAAVPAPVYRGLGGWGSKGWY